MANTQRAGNSCQNRWKAGNATSVGASRGESAVIDRGRRIRKSLRRIMTEDLFHEKEEALIEHRTKLHSNRLAERAKQQQSRQAPGTKAGFFSKMRKAVGRLFGAMGE